MKREQAGPNRDDIHGSIIMNHIIIVDHGAASGTLQPGGALDSRREVIFLTSQVLGALPGSEQSFRPADSLFLGTPPGGFTLSGQGGITLPAGFTLFSLFSGP